MLHIKCPHCGIRSQNEFSYGGDATVKRPELGKEISDQDWDNFVYNRKSLRGKHWELWQHLSGCRQWIKVKRDTVTHEIFQTAKTTIKCIKDGNNFVWLVKCENARNKPRQWHRFM